MLLRDYKDKMNLYLEQRYELDNKCSSLMEELKQLKLQNQKLQARPCKNVQNIDTNLGKMPKPDHVHNHAGASVINTIPEDSQL